MEAMETSENPLCQLATSPTRLFIEGEKNHRNSAESHIFFEIPLSFKNNSQQNQYLFYLCSQIKI